MSRAQQICEILNAPFPYKEVPAYQPDARGFEFTTDGGVQYYVQVARKAHPDPPVSVMWIDFWASTPDEVSTQKVTGTGGQFRTFASIYSILAHCIAHDPPDLVKFTGEGESRTDTYTRLVRRYSTQLGYRLYTEPVVHSDGDGVDFTLVHNHANLANIAQLTYAKK